MFQTIKIKYPFLSVYDYLDSFNQVIVLSAAFRLDLIQLLHQADRPVSVEDIARQVKTKGEGLSVLLAFLSKYRIIEKKNKSYRLTKKFKKTLTYQDLLKNNIEYMEHIYDDLLKNFAPLIKTNLSIHESALHDFWHYNYSTKDGVSDAQRATTKRWMKYITIQTTYDSLFCLKTIRLKDISSVLDVGGNSGEFCRQICLRYPKIHCTVFDLPVVCHIGEQYLAHFKNPSAITFHQGDFTKDPLPQGHDLITMKSVLNDHPDQTMELILQKAHAALSSHGAILISEFNKAAVPLRDLLQKDNLIYFHFIKYFRTPTQYVTVLSRLGFKNIRIYYEYKYFFIRATK
jgi:hypothetical protein